MANPTVKINQKQTNPNLKDLLDLHKKDILLSVNCHAVATIQSFDPDKQTVSATINYKKSYLQRGADGLYKTVLIDYPILLDCPVVILGGGPFHLTFPIAKGDECLILFNDRDIDNWFQSGQVGGVASSRLHSMSDGFALVGVNSMANVLGDYDTTRAVLGNGTTFVGVGETKVKVANGTTTLNTLLAALIDAINAITTTNAVVGAPCAISPASQTALTNIKTQIAGLLE